MHEEEYIRHDATALAGLVRAGEVSAAELDAFCVAHPMLANYKRPRYYRFVDSLPMTATGKKMHYKARGQVLEDSKAGLLEKVSHNLSIISSKELKERPCTTHRKR